MIYNILAWLLLSIISTEVKAQNRPIVYPQNSNRNYDSAFSGQTTFNINFPATTDIRYPVGDQNQGSFATNKGIQRDYGSAGNRGGGIGRSPDASTAFRRNSDTYDDRNTADSSPVITRKKTVVIEEKTQNDRRSSYMDSSPTVVRKVTITQEETLGGNNARDSNSERASDSWSSDTREEARRKYSNTNHATTRRSNDRRHDADDDASNEYNSRNNRRSISSQSDNNNCSGQNCRKSVISNAIENESRETNKRKARSRRLCDRKYAEYMNRIFTTDDDHADAEDLDFDGRVLAEPGEYPHMTALGYKTTNNEVEYKCGGSLISENFVITAAHCTNITGEKPTTVRIGDLDLDVEERHLDPQIRKIQRIYNHPSYRSDSYYYDIALLKLSSNVEFTEFVRPIRLWVDTDIPYDTAYAMGYGSTSFGRARTNRLTDLNMTIVDNEECNRQLPSLPETVRGIIESQICAHDYAMNRDTCQGDSGGPLQLNLYGRRKRSRKHYHLIGITSYGLLCRSDYPSVYTRISSFLDWIEDTVWTAT